MGSRYVPLNMVGGEGEVEGDAMDFAGDIRTRGVRAVVRRVRRVKVEGLANIFVGVEGGRRGLNEFESGRRMKRRTSKWGRINCCVILWLKGLY